MELSEYLPFWPQLSPEDQEILNRAAVKRRVTKGTLLHNGSQDCVGLFVILSGQLRAYILSEAGREITIYRLFSRDICLFSASCMMSSIQFEISIEVEKDAEVFLIPTAVYQALMQRSAAVANYTNALMASRFSEVMWLIDKVLWARFDQRLAAFLLEERALGDSDELTITQERIANHLGTAREVVTRMLRYFQSEGLVELHRGGLNIIDADRLSALAKEDT